MNDFDAIFWIAKKGKIDINVYELHKVTPLDLNEMWDVVNKVIEVIEKLNIKWMKLMLTVQKSVMIFLNCIGMIYT
ncbi:hypothetical protein Metbo_1551 [Methanobacterium lacus]|uniref:Uncharacterized protein n=1 Tax=Methanobacterium lacus (strain AL-21) TaxID=877455 RepID=F0T8V1_METLA|nr:hypothetical protein [Methanobacterium lacus]ADZ09779.1 hypothetical protein Metbo_1551 [Methanobacterium lacus]